MKSSYSILEILTVLRSSANQNHALLNREFSTNLLSTNQQFFGNKLGLNIIIMCKISKEKHLNFLELLQEKKIQTDFLFDEIDVDFYLFVNFLDVYNVQKRVI